MSSTIENLPEIDDTYTGKYLKLLSGNESENLYKDLNTYKQLDCISLVSTIYNDLLEMHSVVAGLTLYWDINDDLIHIYETSWNDKSLDNWKYLVLKGQGGCWYIFEIKLLNGSYVIDKITTSNLQSQICFIQTDPVYVYNGLDYSCTCNGITTVYDNSKSPNFLVFPKGACLSQLCECDNVTSLPQCDTPNFPWIETETIDITNDEKHTYVIKYRNGSRENQIGCLLCNTFCDLKAKDFPNETMPGVNFNIEMMCGNIQYPSSNADRNPLLATLINYAKYILANWDITDENISEECDEDAAQNCMQNYINNINSWMFDEFSGTYLETSPDTALLLGCFDDSIAYQGYEIDEHTEWSYQGSDGKEHIIKSKKEENGETVYYECENYDNPEHIVCKQSAVTINGRLCGMYEGDGRINFNPYAGSELIGNFYPDPAYVDCKDRAIKARNANPCSSYKLYEFELGEATEIGHKYETFSYTEPCNDQETQRTFFVASKAYFDPENMPEPTKEIDGWSWGTYDEELHGCNCSRMTEADKDSICKEFGCQESIVPYYRYDGITVYVCPKNSSGILSPSEAYDEYVKCMEEAGCDTDNNTSNGLPCECLIRQTYK